MSKTSTFISPLTAEALRTTTLRVGSEAGQDLIRCQGESLKHVEWDAGPAEGDPGVLPLW